MSVRERKIYENDLNMQKALKQKYELKLKQDQLNNRQIG